MNGEQNNPDPTNTPEQQPQADPTTDAPTQADPSVPETPVDPQGSTTTTQTPDGEETHTTVEHQTTGGNTQPQVQAGGIANDDPQSQNQAANEIANTDRLADQADNAGNDELTASTQTGKDPQTSLE